MLARIRETKWIRWVLGAALIGVLGVLLAPGSALLRPKAKPEATATRERRAPPRFDTFDSAPTTNSAFDARLDWTGSQHAALAPDSVPAPDLPAFLLDDEFAGVTGSPASIEDAVFDCIIEPFEVVRVGSALTAVLASVEVERSDFVEAGQILARLDANAEEASVVVARARAAMDADVVASQANLVLGTRKMKRAEKLFREDALSEELRDEIQTEADVARAGLQQARERKKLMELELLEAERLLERHTIRSPISGVVVERFKSPGEVVNEETIVTIAQIDPLRVEVILPAAVFGSIAPGMRAEVQPELPDSGVLIASVTLVDRVIDAASGTFGARLELPNSDYALPSGLHCQVRLVPSD